MECGSVRDEFSCCFNMQNEVLQIVPVISKSSTLSRVLNYENIKRGVDQRAYFWVILRWDKKLKCKSNNAKSRSGEKLSEPIHDQAATQCEKNNLNRTEATS